MNDLLSMSLFCGSALLLGGVGMVLTAAWRKFIDRTDAKSRKLER